MQARLAPHATRCCCCRCCCNGCRSLFPAIVSCYAEVCDRILSGASTHAPQGSSASAKLEVCLNEEIFAATLHVLTDGFLHMPRKHLGFDVHETAAAAAELVAITNTFVTQPWKRWGYLALPGLCQVRDERTSAFHHAAIAAAAAATAIANCSTRLLRDPSRAHWPSSRPQHRNHALSTRTAAA